MGFGLVCIQKCQKFQLTFFFPFLTSHYGFTKCCEIIENCKIQFCSLFGWLFKNFALKTYDTLKMFLLSAQNNFSIMLYSYVHVQKNSSLNFLSLVGFQASKIWMFFWKISCKASLEIIFRQKYFPRAPCFFIFWQSSIWPGRIQESCESWLVGFGVNICSKMQKTSANNFFWHLWQSCHYGFTNYFEIKIFAFSNTIPRVVSNCKILIF